MTNLVVDGNRFENIRQRLERDFRHQQSDLQADEPCWTRALALSVPVSVSVFVSESLSPSLSPCPSHIARETLKDRRPAR